MYPRTRTRIGYDTVSVFVQLNERRDWNKNGGHHTVRN
jgi:hypothetical protein